MPEINQRKIYALLFCLGGVLLYNTGRFFDLDDAGRLYAAASGLFISFTGLALYISGIKKKVKRKIRICPKCFFKNDASNLTCVKCREPLI